MQHLIDNLAIRAFASGDYWFVKERRSDIGLETWHQLVYSGWVSGEQMESFLEVFGDEMSQHALDTIHSIRKIDYAGRMDEADR